MPLTSACLDVELTNLTPSATAMTVCTMMGKQEDGRDRDSRRLSLFVEVNRDKGLIKWRVNGVTRHTIKS